MEVDKVFETPKSLPAYLQYHPHSMHEYITNSLNTIYVATQRLTWEPKLPGGPCI